MVVNKTLDVRWIKRYRLFCLGGSVILIIQVFLAYIFLAFDSGYEKPTQEYLSGKGRLNVEVLEDHNSVESSRKFRDHYLGQDDDDEEGLGNSNAVYSKVKLPPDKFESIQKSKQVPSKTNNKIIEGNKTVLRLEELDFLPICEIKSKEAISAIHRARTQHCKQTIANISCLISSSNLYPEKLPHTCPSSGLESGKPMGCYQDDKALRLLTGFYQNLKTTNSPNTCLDICTKGGFPYAGVQYGTECFCGVSEPPSSARLPDSSCNMKCPLDPKQPCGGFYTVNIYQTGIAKLSKETADLVSSSPTGVPRARVLFLLTLNGRSIRQVKRLIKVLYHVSHYFYVHVDARQDYLMRHLLDVEKKLENVRLSRNRNASIWGGASLLTVLLRAMIELVPDKTWKWDYVINLSESDFPVKTNDELVDFLTVHRERNFVKSHGREVQRFIQKQGLDKTFVECDAHMWRIGDRNLPSGIVIDGGSDWFALSRPFVEYLVTYDKDPLLQGLVTFFKYTLLPAESFFHTALRNSPFCRTYIDNNLHVTNWRRHLGCKCQYKHIVDWCGCSPNNFRLEDWGRLQSTKLKPVFFARKFEPAVDQSIINQVEAWLYGPFPSNVTAMESYWHSTYSSLDLGPRPDDALISIALSLARATSRRKLNCSISSTNKILEITSYYRYDAYVGSLILYNITAKGNHDSILLETWVRPVGHYTVLETMASLSALKRVEVSSDYDQKESVARNWLRTLGPFSEPVAIYYLEQPISGYNLTLLWIDPIGTLADVSFLSISGDSLTGFIKSSLKAPLFPGIWTLRVLYGGKAHSETSFLVTPLELLNGSPLTQREAGFMHRGPSERYPKRGEDWGIRGGGNALERRALANARRTGKDLQQWIDSLSSRFYEIVESCVVKKRKWCDLPVCENTNWSSLSPDPKSELTRVDEFSGRMKRW
ncbi:xylosyltransferase oxt isoform X2 [Halyomorpha halys]|uniref:xylosyltransferase oxt isoform X2 n=1 Tax=Halyomorpha halys TaxID=286706 RepID=UPI0006D520D9|nr:xylosyltransferase oxt-like isoform X2 [Halyomorpha halys]